MKFDYKAEDLIIKPYKSESPVYVRKQKGHYQRIRQLTGLAFVLLFILVPWINFQGHQAILLDIGKQQFHVFYHYVVRANLVWLYLSANGLDFQLYLGRRMARR